MKKNLFERVILGGRRVVIRGGGVSTGKAGVEVTRREVRVDGRGVPVDIDGVYQPIDWSKETVVRLDDGDMIVVSNSRVVNERVEDMDAEEAAGVFLKDVNELQKAMWRKIDDAILRAVVQKTIKKNTQEIVDAALSTEEGWRKTNAPVKKREEYSFAGLMGSIVIDIREGLIWKCTVNAERYVLDLELKGSTWVEV